MSKNTKVIVKDDKTTVKKTLDDDESYSGHSETVSERLSRLRKKNISETSSYQTQTSGQKIQHLHDTPMEIMDAQFDPNQKKEVDSHGYFKKQGIVNTMNNKVEHDIKADKTKKVTITNRF